MIKQMLAGATALALVGGGAAAVEAQQGSMPQLRFAITPQAVKQVGSAPIGAGFHRMTLTASRPGASVALVKLKHGVSVDAFDAAVPKIQDPNQIAQYGQIVASTFFGSPAPYVTTLRFADADYVFLDTSKRPVPRLSFHAGPQPDDGGVRLPAEDATVKLVDYRFVMPATLKAGKRVVRTMNDGKHVHHALMVPLKRGVDTKKVLADLRKGKEPKSAAAGPPTALVDAVSPHATNDVEVNLRKGKYLFVCFMQNRPDAKPHAMLGMEKIVTVR